MNRWALIAAAAVAALLLGGSASASPGWVPGTWQGEIRRYASQIETVTGPWPGLGDYLVAVAFWESSHRDGSKPNPSACEPPCSSSSARGWYQIQPPTAGHGAEQSPQLLFSPPWSTAAAADLIYRLNRNRAGPGQTPDWLAIRRGWKMPARVSDVPEEQSLSAGVRERFAQALEGIGLNPGFMYQRAVPAGLHWPGFDAVLAAVEGSDQA